MLVGDVDDDFAESSAIQPRKRFTGVSERVDRVDHGAELDLVELTKDVPESSAWTHVYAAQDDLFQERRK